MFLTTVACCWLVYVLPQEKFSMQDLPIPALISKLNSKNSVERQDAAYELGVRGEKARVAVPRLLELLRKDTDCYVRVAAAYALARAGQHDKAVVAVLVESLKKEPDAGVRFSVAAALGDLGPSARSAIPALIEALKDADRWVRGNAAGALAQIGPDDAAARALQETLKDKCAPVRVVAAVSLLKGQPRDRTAFVVLVRAIKREEDLKDLEDSEANFVACGFFLRGIDQKRTSMVPALIDALTDEDAHVRHCAAYTLELIGPPAKAAIPALTKALDDKNAKVRVSAARALKKLKGQTKERP